jgi:hypothetical protein
MGIHVIIYTFATTYVMDGCSSDMQILQQGFHVWWALRCNLGSRVVKKGWEGVDKTGYISCQSESAMMNRRAGCLVKKWGTQKCERFDIWNSHDGGYKGYYCQVGCDAVYFHTLLPFSILSPEYGGSMFLRNVDSDLPGITSQKTVIYGKKTFV